MILIIGGAYQGKLDFAKEQFGITEADIHTCADGQIDFSRRCIDKVEAFAACHPDPIGYFEENRAAWQDSILILQDIFCGVVPMGAENRVWRQKTGRLAQYLTREAAQVSRIFCGLEQRLK
ncbi:MAG: bifunctional adenosylcobinamide kinase/adenosylcobinamide-phosphate guanylyltransferase [Oscillospiraceae bacterium]|nr:bifunctional adenosylcobinamide kinase/adenosylcobinamide-phosphate guanylyltransferase [Oscillospiraceae bacterium]MBR2889975.1 bifunctional adenosylcobinamide kinase/adenosylcobinamide-phosphate guanylyltransferase [Oscillospiraceae bacterium]